MQRIYCARFWVMGLGLLFLAFVAGPVEAVNLRSWDKQISNAKGRFKVLGDFDNAAVLDKETQLVWERSPSTNIGFYGFARQSCFKKSVGKRLGWRLPAASELASLLVDPPDAFPSLPSGHPFIGIIIPSTTYWSVTKRPVPGFVGAWYVDFSGVADPLQADKIELASKHRWWCVRGGTPEHVFD